ncbi:hypothetical protein [Stenotrophomonas maltophilia]|uniref:hypothetical protein n=1 Tax=Stenotrophomonas maltophilia TaxID=40324 RepID=UPI0039C455AA
MKTELHGISTTTLCAITAFAFSAGAISAGWAVGKFSTSGNAADWVAALGGAIAAVGTWAIGIGANNYAREAHLQRIDEQARLERRSREEQARRLNVIRLKLRRASRLNRPTRYALPKGFHGPLQDAPIMGGLLAIPMILETLKWLPEEVVMLDRIGQAMMATLEGRLLTVAGILRMMKEDENSYGSVEFRNAFAILAKVCAEVNEASIRLIKRVEADLTALSSDEHAPPKAVDREAGAPEGL